MAQAALLLSPDFHISGQPQPQGARPEAEPTPLSEPRSYKAFVSLFFNGGADTFNLLVPMNCGLYDEYVSIRQDIALTSFQLNMITTSGQSCDRFGIHSSFPILKQLYDNGQAAFFSNIGSLVEPLNLQTWKDGGRRCAGLFSHSDSRAGTQTLKCQQPGSAPRGAGGRIADALASGTQKYQVTSFSLAGTSTFSQGFQTTQEILSKKDGVVRLADYDLYKAMVGNISMSMYSNIYAEEYAKAMTESVAESETIGSYLDGVTLQTEYEAETGLQMQFHQVARIIATRDQRKSERDIFFVELYGFDHHSDVIEGLQELFQEASEAIEGFVAEMEAQGVFDKVVIATTSDFGRTLSSNGQGTDHAWAGNHFVVGGNLKESKIYNDYPVSLLEGNAQDAGRGRLIPKYPWESMMLPIAEWMGVEDSQLESVFPNLGNFNSSQLVRAASVFQS